MNNHNQIELGEQVQWNLAQAITMEIANLRVKANAHFIRREVDKSFECLMAMRMTCNYVITKDQSDELDKLENECLKLINKVNKEVRGFGALSLSKEKLEARNELYQKYRQYSNLLQKILDDYGFLGGRKADPTKMKF